MKRLVSESIKNCTWVVTALSNSFILQIPGWPGIWLICNLACPYRQKNLFIWQFHQFLLQIVLLLNVLWLWVPSNNVPAWPTHFLGDEDVFAQGPNRYLTSVTFGWSKLWIKFGSPKRWHLNWAIFDYFDVLKQFCCKIKSGYWNLLAITCKC